MTEKARGKIILQRALFTSGAAIFVASIAFGQNPPPSPSNQDRVSSTTLDGCVAAGADRRKTLTLANAASQETYVLKGLDVRDFVGKHVEIIGLPSSKRFRVVGGLYPSANVAAQAGGIDPVQAAIAGQGGPTAQASKPAVEFNVKSVRIMPGACPER
jgi:hypothetical protein